MKPYCATTEDYGDTGCCPGHDNPSTRKWSGEYSSTHAQQKASRLTRLQNRSRRRKDKQERYDDEE